MVHETRELQFKRLVPEDHADAGFENTSEADATLSLLTPSDTNSSQAEASMAADSCASNVRGPSVLNGRQFPSRNQLTIFYAGTVNVYDDVPEDKAHAIMLLAGKGTPANINQLLGSLGCLEMPPNPCATLPSFSEPAQKVQKLQAASSPSSGLFLSLSSQLSRSSEGMSFHTSVPKISCPAVPCHALPQARKASLTRFLQRRKESGNRAELVQQKSVEHPSSETTLEEKTDDLRAQEESSPFQERQNLQQVQNNSAPSPGAVVEA